MRLTLQIEIPDVTTAEARQVVRDLDAMEDTVPIAEEKVKALHVAEALLSGNWNPVHHITIDQMRDA